VQIQTISATELARNTREILDSVAAHGSTIVVERNRSRVVKISPCERTLTAAQVLEGMDQYMLFSAQEASAWLKDSKDNFGHLVDDPWG
jgi:antitoxin (DNA-binding transcriptional repressor) of toxin-antitoxin stability system